jgi:transposase
MDTSKGLGIIIKQEVCMGSEGRRKFDREFKVETARLIVEGGRKVTDVARDFDIHENVLRKWKNQYIEDKEHSFPGKGRLKPEDEELRRLKRELADMREERDILKKPWPSSQNTRNEVSVYKSILLRIQGKEDVPYI